MRCGPHVMGAMPPGTPARAMYERWITTLHPAAVKFCRQGFDPELMDWTRAQGPRVIGRWVEGEIGDGGRTLNELLQFAAHLDYVEFANEESQGKDDPEEWDRLMGLCLWFMQDLDQANSRAGRTGPKACIANLSVGCPELERWSRPSTLEVARYADANGHAWGVHEYYKPTPWAGLLHQNSEGRDDEKALWDGPAGSPRGWLMLRVVRVIEIMKANGITGFRFLVTESGRDNVPGQPGDGGGFRDVPGDPFDQYMAQYGRHLSALPECKGWVDYGWNAWEGWRQFDQSLDPAMFERFLAAQLTLRADVSSPPPAPEEVPTMIEGIDVSRWQGAVGWPKASAAGARFAWCKATEGTGWIDPRFNENATGAAAAGLLVGGYHFYKNDLDPLAQARHFAQVCARYKLTLPPALDFEDTASPADPAAMQTFCGEVWRLMGRPVIYTAAWWWNRSRLGGSQPWASRYPLWVADYEGAVSVPTDWTDWTVHQHTSSGHGPTFGAGSARIDRNRYRGTVAELAALCQTVASELDVAALVAAAEAEHQERGVRFNPSAGIQRAILADGYVPTTNERDHDDASGHYVYQRAERLAGGEPRVYVWDPRAGAVRWVPGGAA